MRRRDALKLAAVAPLAARVGAMEEDPWSAEWDRALLQAAVERLDRDFDPAESMLRREVGAGYNYHSTLRSRVAHPTQPSLQYALALLEAGSEARASRAAGVLERVIALQDADPASRWYGIWGYYMEEPPSRMSPADWNWADFNGALLLLVADRHGSRLAPALLAGVKEAIRHAAASIRRRNISMLYTNIALQGTFVTLATAQLLDDAGLRVYAVERLQRFAATVDATGSFAEYNSPTYANVSIANLTRMRMLLRDADTLALAQRIHDRAWLHLASHWHAPTRQLAGPMSRCYSTDVGSPLWIQKALRGRLAFTRRDELPGVNPTAALEVAVHEYRCPEELVTSFTALHGERQHRELFYVAVPGEPDVVHARPAEAAPVQGTTWLHPDVCLGSANRADFWVQRRPLLAYWGGPARPARFAQLRCLKDDYDFSSALLFAVQQHGCILGLVCFRSPGGDRHIGLDPIANGEFRASRLRLCLEIAGAPDGAGTLEDGGRFAIDLGGARLWFQVRDSVFGAHAPKVSLEHEKERTVLALDFLPPGDMRTVRWPDVRSAYATFTLAMAGAGESLASLDRRCRASAYESSVSPDGRLRAAWASPAGNLALTGSALVLPVADHDRAFSDSLHGRPVPLQRLSEERLVRQPQRT